MEKERRIEILTEALDKAYEKLASLSADDFAGEGAGRVIYNIDTLTYKLERENGEFYKTIDYTADPTFNAVVIKDDEVKPEVKVTPVSEATIVKTTPAAVGSISKEELREQLSALSNKHDDLDLPGIMAEMGHEKLSEFQPSEYAELLKRAKAAVKELT